LSNGGKHSGLYCEYLSIDFRQFGFSSIISDAQFPSGDAFTYASDWFTWKATRMMTMMMMVVMMMMRRRRRRKKWMMIMWVTW